MSNFAKFLKGVVKYRQTAQSGVVQKLKEVKAHGHPAAVLYACMDARITPLCYTNAEAGDMYIVRNAGNMIPMAGCGHEVTAVAEPAGLDLTVKLGKIKHVVVCGHSDCKAMNGLYTLHKHPEKFDMNSPLHHWLEQRGYLSLEKLEQRMKGGPSSKLRYAESCPHYSFDAKIDPEDKYDIEDKLSQINTLQQIENITSHKFMAEILQEKLVDLHAFWFEIANGEMHIFSKAQQRFVVINDKNIDNLVSESEQHKA